jgi:hypothetical protein
MGRISRMSRRTRTLAAVLIAAAAFPLGAADAKMLVTNRDEKDHKLTVIIEGQSNREVIIKPTQVLEDVCPKGCVIRLNDNEEDEYQLEPDDEVSIEDGYLYYDKEPVTAPEADPKSSPRDGKKQGG